MRTPSTTATTWASCGEYLHDELPTAGARIAVTELEDSPMPSQTLPRLTVRLLTIIRNVLLFGLPLCLSCYGLRL